MKYTWLLKEKRQQQDVTRTVVRHACLDPWRTLCRKSASGRLRKCARSRPPGQLNPSSPRPHDRPGLRRTSTVRACTGCNERPEVLQTRREYLWHAPCRRRSHVDVPRRTPEACAGQAQLLRGEGHEEDHRQGPRPRRSRGLPPPPSSMLSRRRAQSWTTPSGRGGCSMLSRL
jgi:hypothetical protein